MPSEISSDKVELVTINHLIMGFALFDKGSEGQYVIQSCELLLEAYLSSGMAASSLYHILNLTLGLSHIV